MDHMCSRPYLADITSFIPSIMRTVEQSFDGPLHLNNSADPSQTHKCDELPNTINLRLSSSSASETRIVVTSDSLG